MWIGDAVRVLLGRNTTAAIDRPSVPVGDVALNESAIYRSSDFPRYNPDDLVGRKGFGIYRKMMADEQVKAVVRFRRNAVTGRNWRFEVDNDILSDSECNRRIAVCEAIIDQMHGSFKSALDGMMSALYNGYSVTEKVFAQIEHDGVTWWGLNYLRRKPAETFEFYTDEYGTLVRVTQRLGMKEIDISPQKLILHVQNSDEDEQYGRSELREAYRAYFSKDIIIKFHNIHLERHGSGTVVLRPTDERELVVGSGEWNKMKTILQRLQTSTGILLPSGIEMDVINPATTDAFERAVAMHDKSIAKALLMPNLLGLSEQGQTGSYSQSQTQLEAFLWMLDNEAAALEETLNEQLFRQLGELNFGDAAWPRFRFDPLSDSMKMMVISTWKDLVGARAVNPSSSDEQHLRDMLRFPYREEDKEDDGGGGAVDPQTALNGAQVASLLQVVDRVRVGEIPPSTAVEILITSFPINRAQAEQIIADVEVKPQQPQQPQQGQDGVPGKPMPQDAAQPSGNLPDETVRPQATATVSAMWRATVERAAKRVAFKVIEQRSEDIVDETSSAMSKVMAAALNSVVQRIQDEDIVTKADASAIDQIGLDKKTVSKLRRVVQGGLRAGWALGQQHARDEVDVARGERFKADFERLGDLAGSFFDARSFQVAGKLTEDATSIIKNILLGAIKYDKGTEETIRDIYSAFMREGLVDEADVDHALAEALGTDNPKARLRTIIRTNAFEAINEARYSYFRDPSLDGFVEALEYSAILDSRTTQICQHLDGQVHAADSDVWTTYRPPNHFNCRSVLIPVTQRDTWSESDDPSIDPQEGFK